MKDKKRDKIIDEAIAFIHIMSEDTVSEKKGKDIIKKLWKIKLCNKHFVSNNEVAVNCMNCHYGDRLAGEPPCIDCDGISKHRAIN